MLKNQMKKAVSVLLSSAIVFGFTGCLDFGGGKKAVIEAAGELAENMAAADMISGFIDTTMSGFWLADDDDIYYDTDFIEYDYYFDSAVLDYAARGERMYFVLSKDGSDLYSGPDFIFGESTNVVCRVDGDLIGLPAVILLRQALILSVSTMSDLMVMK